MSCGVGHRHDIDLTLLWLWYRPAATAPIGPCVWETPYAMGAALEKTKKTKKKKKKKKERKKAGVAILLPDKIDFKAKNVTRDKEGIFTIIL